MELVAFGLLAGISFSRKRRTSSNQSTPSLQGYSIKLNAYYAAKRNIPRLDDDADSFEDVVAYYRNHAIRGLAANICWSGEVLEQKASPTEPAWGAVTTFTTADNPDHKLYSVYIYNSHRGKGHMSRWLKAHPEVELVTAPSCQIEQFLQSRGVRFQVLTGSGTHFQPEYDMVTAYYGDSVTDRTGIHMINHIDEGLFILNAIGASELAKRAYIIHPLVQGDPDLKMFWNSPLPEMCNDPRVFALALEYRNIANAHLSWHPPVTEQNFNDSPLKDVNDMLITDKIQNCKDFEMYHKQTHPRAERLSTYFKEWFDKLGVSDEMYRDLVQQMYQRTGGEELARKAKKPSEAPEKALEDQPGYNQVHGGGGKA